MRSNNSIKQMKLRTNAGTNQAIAAYAEMQFHNTRPIIVLTAS